MEAGFEERINRFAAVLEEQQKQDRVASGVGCEANLIACKTKVVMGKKYAKVNIGYSGAYMVVIDTEEIFGIKAYGVIHTGHYFGKLSEIDGWYWGGYRGARRKDAA